MDSRLARYDGSKTRGVNAVRRKPFIARKTIEVDLQQRRSSACDDQVFLIGELDLEICGLKLFDWAKGGVNEGLKNNLLAFRHAR